VPLPAPAPPITNILVFGALMPEEMFPRRQRRRINPTQPFTDVAPFGKRSMEHLDYSVDLTSVLEDDEYVLGCYAWSSAPADLVVTWVRYASKGAQAYVSGGIDGQVYQLILSVKTTDGRILQYICEIEIVRGIDEAEESYVPPLLLSDTDPDIIYLTDVNSFRVAPPLRDATGGWYLP